MIFISILVLIVAKALPFLKNHISPIHFTRISALIFIYSSVLTFNTLYIQSIGSGLGIYSGLFQVTLISQFMELFLYLIGFFILIGWPLNSRGCAESPDYSLIVLFSTLGSCLLLSSSDLVSMYLSIELQSFGLYVLSTLYRDSESSTKAGLKYFLLGGLSSGFILLGSGLIYAFTGLTQFESIYSLISAIFSAMAPVSGINNILLGLVLGVILIIIGFLFKIAAAPLHNWSPDVYDETPTIVTIWLTIMPKIAILILLLELQTQIGVIGSLNNVLDSLDLIKFTAYPLIVEGIGLGLDTIALAERIGLNPVVGLGNFEVVPAATFILKNLLLITSLLSLIIGTVVGLAQTRIKRLFAYSTISHIGFILLALAINSEQSIESFLFYIIQYSITNLDVFLIILALGYIIYPIAPYVGVGLSQEHNNLSVGSVGSVGRAEQNISYISELKGQFFLNPLLSISLSICLFSMAGIPPLIGFFSKQFVLSSAIQSGYYFIAFVAILVSVVSASYYLKIIKVLLSPAKAPLRGALAGTLEVNQFKEDILNLNNGEAFTFEEPTNTNKTNTPLKMDPLSLESSYSLGEGPLGGAIAEKRTVSNFHSFLISTLTLSILFFIFKSSLILNSTQLLTLSLFYF